MGSLAGQPHYLRLYEILHSAHSNYSITLDQSASELYLGLLKACLKALAQILEVSSVVETSRIAEELLHYLQSSFTLLPMETLTCVRQLLKSLFGANLVARYHELNDFKMNTNQRESLETEEQARVESGFYEELFQKPGRLVAERIKDFSNNCIGCNEPEVNTR